MSNTRERNGKPIGDDYGDLSYVPRPIKKIVAAEVPQLGGRVRASRTRAVRPPIGPVPGESESEITPAGHEQYPDPISDEEIALGRTGVAAAREALEKSGQNS